MENNARFLPGLTQTLCAWVQNLQSPRLKRKLVDFENSLSLSPSGLLDGKEGKRLSIMVQQRLWSMMQVKLYDPSAARKISWEPSSEDEKTWLKNEEDEGGYEELLEFMTGGGSLHREQEVFHPESSNNGNFENAQDDFVDLSMDGDSDDDLLLLEDLDKEERERLETEYQTEEMLFGVGWAIEGSEEESMSA
jgi:hypothetical protein